MNKNSENVLNGKLKTFNDVSVSDFFFISNYFKIMDATMNVNQISSNHYNIIFIHIGHHLCVLPR